MTIPRSREYCGAPHPTIRNASCVLGAGHNPAVPHRSLNGDRWTDDDQDGSDKP